MAKKDQFKMLLIVLARVDRCLHEICQQIITILINLLEPHEIRAWIKSWYKFFPIVVSSVVTIVFVNSSYDNKHLCRILHIYHFVYRKNYLKFSCKLALKPSTYRILILEDILFQSMFSTILDIFFTNLLSNIFV